MRRFLALGLVFLGAFLLLSTFLGAAAQAETVPAPAELSLNSVPNPQRIGQLGGPVRRMVAGDGAVYATVGPALTVFDVVSGSAPVRRGSVVLPDVPDGVAISGTHVLVVASRLRVIDVSDPDRPVNRGTGSVAADYRDVAVNQGYAYAVAHSFQEPHGALHVYDVSDVAAPERINVTSLGVYAHGVRISGTLAYVANGFQGLRILDVTDPAAPAAVSTFGTQAAAFDVALYGNYAFVLVSDCVVSCSGGVEVIDVSQPGAPQAVGFYGASQRLERIEVVDQRAYIAAGEGGVLVLDISDPEQPAFVASRQWGWPTTDVAAHAGQVLAAAPDYGLRAFVDDAQLTPVSTIRTTSVALDAVGESGPGGVELVYVGDGAGLRIVDLADERVVGVLEQDRPVRGIAADYPRAYLAADSDGLVVVDVTTSTAPAELGRYNTPGTAYGVVLRGDYAYVADGDAGLRVIDVSDPFQPVEVGALDTPGEARGVAVDGDRAYVADWDRGVRLVDISNPAAPVEISFYNTPGQSAGVDARGDVVYVADSLSGVRIIDVSDPLLPVEVGAFLTQRYVDDVAAIGGYVYVANDDSGMVVLDVTDPTSPFQVASVGSSGRTLAVDLSPEGVIYAADWIGGVRAYTHAVFSLSGMVNQANGVGFDGVNLALSSGASTTTGGGGAFAFDGLSPGSYGMTPTLSGYVFTPAELADVVPPDNDQVIFTILPPPLTATVGPAGRRVIFTDTQGLTTTLDFPAGAFTTTGTVLVTPTVSSGGPLLNFAGHALELAVEGGNPDAEFGEPVTVTIRYSEDDLRAVWDEATLALYRWDGSGWVPAQETCSPAGEVVHEVAANVIATEICRTGRYALLGERLRVYMPTILRQ